MLRKSKSNKKIKLFFIKVEKNSIEQKVTIVTNFNSKRSKDFMYVEIRISVKWKNSIIIIHCQCPQKLALFPFPPHLTRASLYMCNEWFCEVEYEDQTCLSWLN